MVGPQASVGKPHTLHIRPATIVVCQSQTLQSPCCSAGSLAIAVMQMQAVSLDRFAADLAVILALDWLLDRCRTAINLLGDAFGVVLIDHLACQTGISQSSTQYSQLELT